MRTLVCGGRKFKNVDLLANSLNDIHQSRGPITHLIEGEAPGADLMARAWAILHRIPVLPYPAEWGRYGKEAGFKRNRQMIEEGKPDLVVAFPGGRGTRSMISIAKIAGVEVIEFPRRA